MRRRFTTLDVFTERPFAGNPLAVLPDARGLTDPQMLAVTREFNFSETTFVLPPETATAARRVRIFTPGGELPFAGHPTIGTAVALVADGYVAMGERRLNLVFELGAGPTPVTVTVDHGRYAATFTAPRRPVRGPTTPPERVAAALGLPADAIDAAAHPPVDIGCGLDFVAVRLRDGEALAACRPRLDAWAELESPAAGHGVVAYVVEAAGRLRGRMFGPGVGVVEDPATGSAAAALGGLLAGLEPAADGRFAWTLTQGVEMGRPSRLEVAADKAGGEVTAVRVAGAAVVVADGTIELPD
ncbi:MAG: PhzF family phenazine biosynthesis isomerase [Alphaproteobacteria bacterium]|jgi:trans-2,3-dihydro-3-hydroxyanthranilate isomerase|nr:PhzF family phenazine biosynthesis isomerase [Alphaproteobacteria bacterium]